jgi:hypothetical protein
MSRIYFHTQNEDEAEVHGSERAYMGHVVNLLGAALGQDSWRNSWHDEIEQHLTEYGRTMYRSRNDYPSLMHRDLSTLIGSFSDRPIFHDADGTPLDNFSLVLNTVLAIGSDAMCLLARLHAQCEIHAYVEGPHRSWMADLIQEGLDSKLYRASLRPGNVDGTRGEPHGQGWEELITLLRARDDAPVVTSYSVCEQFPNAETARWETPEGYELPADEFYPDESEEDRADRAHDQSWYDLTDEQRWDAAIAGLRAVPDHGLEISPATLRYRYQHSMSLLDVLHG